MAKVLDLETAVLEYTNSNAVRALDPQSKWSITASYICELSPVQTNREYNKNPDRTYQIVYKYGGVSLLDLLKKPGADDPDIIINDETRFYQLNDKSLTPMIKLVKKMLPGIDELNTHYIHGDVHLGNIVYDGKTPRLIDFTSLTQVDDSRIEDIRTLYDNLKTIVKSSWVSKVFPKHFNRWGNEQHGTREEYYRGILTCPEP